MAAKQEVKVETTGGDKRYELEHYYDVFRVYKYNESREFGEASKLEEALALIRLDASQYGTVKKTTIK